MDELPVLDFFFEEDCPFCRSVRINIIEKLEGKGIVIINPIEVDVNTGAVEMGWYDSFCREVKSEPTPLLRLHDKLIGENNWEFAFLMWKKKHVTITEDVLSSEEYLEKQIYDKIRLMKGKPLREYMQEYHQRPDVKAMQREYEQHPDVKAKRRKHMQEYHQRPDVKARRREYSQRYYQRHRKAEIISIMKADFLRLKEIDPGKAQEIADEMEIIEGKSFRELALNGLAPFDNKKIKECNQ